MREKIERDANGRAWRVTRWKPRANVLDRECLPEVGVRDDAGLECVAVDFEAGMALWIGAAS